MSMPTAATVAQSIVSNLDIPAAGRAKALSDYTAIVNAIRAMVLSATVVPDALLAPPGVSGGPVTGTGSVT
jgi:hypothetical protein